MGIASCGWGAINTHGSRPLRVPPSRQPCPHRAARPPPRGTRRRDGHAGRAGHGPGRPRRVPDGRAFRSLMFIAVGGAPNPACTRSSTSSTRVRDCSCRARRRSGDRRSVGLPGSMNRRTTPRSWAHWSSAFPVSSGPLSSTIVAGHPWTAATRSSTCATRAPGRPVSTSIASASRVKVSMTVRRRTRRRAARASLRTSSVHSSFGRLGPGERPRPAAPQRRARCHAQPTRMSPVEVVITPANTMSPARLSRAGLAWRPRRT